MKLKNYTSSLPLLIILALIGFVGYSLVGGEKAPSETDPIVEESNLPIDTVPANKLTSLYDGWVNPNTNADASVKLVEFSDFQCPACKAYYPVVKELEQEYGDKFSFTYKHFPLESIHPNAKFAAQAAEAAGKEGKFWEMHDILFDNQAEWSALGNPIEKFGEYAASIDLDPTVVTDAIRNADFTSEVNFDLDFANELKLGSTPSFILDGEIIRGLTVAELENKLREAIGLEPEVVEEQ